MACQLKDRIFVSEMKDNRHGVVSEGYSRPHHYCDWSDVIMMKAIAMVEKDVSIRHVSEMFVMYLYRGRVQHGSKPGKAPYLNRRGNC